MSVPASTLEDMIMVRPVPRLVQCAASIADNAACCNGCGFCSVLHLAYPEEPREIKDLRCQIGSSGPAEQDGSLGVRVRDTKSTAYQKPRRA